MVTEWRMTIEASSNSACVWLVGEERPVVSSRMCFFYRLQSIILSISQSVVSIHAEEVASVHTSFRSFCLILVVIKISSSWIYRYLKWLSQYFHIYSFHHWLVGYLKSQKMRMRQSPSIHSRMTSHFSVLKSRKLKCYYMVFYVISTFHFFVINLRNTR